MTSDLDALSLSDLGVNDGSFEMFYMEQRRPLTVLAYGVSGDWSVAEDLAQETLVAAYKAWDQIRGKDNPGTWVRRILLNKASSWSRRRWAEAKALARTAPDPTSTLMPEVTGEVHRIWGEVRRLPRRQVEVIALTYIEGLSQVEIAATLGISKESVNTHMRRARLRLAKALDLEEES